MGGWHEVGVENMRFDDCCDCPKLFVGKTVLGNKSHYCIQCHTDIAMVIKCANAANNVKQGVLC